VVLRPKKVARGRSRRDPLWNIVGLGRTNEGTVASNVDRYLYGVAGVTFDINAGVERVHKEIIALLPGDPWKGGGGSGRAARQSRARVRG
jgi:hypothetical protein